MRYRLANFDKNSLCLNNVQIYQYWVTGGISLKLKNLISIINKKKAKLLHQLIFDNDKQIILILM